MTEMNEAIRKAARRQNLDPDEKPEPKRKREIDVQALADGVDQALVDLKSVGDDLRSLREEILPAEPEEDTEEEEE